MFVIKFYYKLRDTGININSKQGPKNRFSSYFISCFLHNSTLSPRVADPIIFLIYSLLSSGYCLAFLSIFHFHSLEGSHIQFCRLLHLIFGLFMSVLRSFLHCFLRYFSLLFTLPFVTFHIAFMSLFASLYTLLYTLLLVTFYFTF